MKKLLISLALIVLVASCSIVVFSDINDYMGCEILRMELDSTGSIRYYETIVRKPNGQIDPYMIMRPEFADIYKVGDTIK